MCVQLPSGKTEKVSVRNIDTVGDLKTKIDRAGGPSTHEQNLTVRNKLEQCKDHFRNLVGVFKRGNFSKEYFYTSFSVPFWHKDGCQNSYILAHYFHRYES